MSREDLPAIFGGDPIRSEPPPNWPRNDPAILAAMQRAFAAGTWGHYDGPAVELLAARIGEHWGVPRVLPCASGTLAVEISLQAFGVGVGDEVVLSAYDYEGNFLTVLALGAVPVLVDCRSVDAQIDVSLIEPALTPKTRAVIVSHLHGGIADVVGVVEICRPRGVGVLEDAAQMPGAILSGGRRAGTTGDLGVISFGGSKLMSCGRGGAILANDARAGQRAANILKRGVQQWAVISELQASILMPQFETLDFDRLRRHEWLRRLRTGCADLPLAVMDADGEPDFYKLGLFVDVARWGADAKFLSTALRAENFAVDPGFRPLMIGRSPSRFRAASDLTKAAALPDRLMKLHHPTMLEGDSSADALATALRRLYNHPSRLPYPQG